MEEEFQIPNNAEEAEAIVNGFDAAPGTGIHTKEPVAQTFKLSYRGKEEEHPLDKIMSYAQQGRDYNERMQKFNQERTLLSAQVQAEAKKNQEIQERLARYQEIEDYQKKDPTWWGHVVESYKAKTTQQPTAQLPPEVAEKIQKVDQFMAAQQERELVERNAKEDQALDLEISQYREKWPHMEWDKVDEQGLNLEQRILAHAQKSGLNKPEHFRMAANDLLQDEILKRNEHATKEGVGKHLEKVTKLGMGPVTDKRTLGLRAVRNVADKSWDEIAQEAIEAGGLT